MPDLDNWRCRASAAHKLLTDPKTKEAKERGDLSETTKTFLKEVYIEQIWGLTKDLDNKFVNKGKLCEADAIVLLSRLDKKLYEKNTTRLSDDYFTGEMDIVERDESGNPIYCIDNKCSWSAFSFIEKLNEPLEPTYETQMNVYLELLKIEQGRVSYTLVDTPDEIIMEEERKLSYKMGALSSESPEFLAAKEYLWLSSKYSHIPIEQRHIGLPVKRNPEIIEKLQQRVEKAREYLKKLHEDHLKLNQ